MTDSAVVVNDIQISTGRDNPAAPLRWSVAFPLIALAGIGYWLAFATLQLSAAILLALPCIFLLSRLKTARSAFYFGSLCGLVIYVPQLWFFLSIFHIVSLPIWCIAAWPIALFLMLVQQSRKRFGPTAAMWLTPIVWTGIEYFRSELYQLKFAWILPGQVVSFLPGARCLWIGVYGLGFLYALGAALLVGPKRIFQTAGCAVLMVLGTLMYAPANTSEKITAGLAVAGMQYEHPSPRIMARELERLAIEHPEAPLLVLPEYAFDGPVPEIVRDVLRKHHRYLITGGVVELGDEKFRDVAYVIGPDGRELFQQCKSVPVQFMQDGLPAETRKVWDSPWGKIGIAICYDISYTRAMDDFVRAGAQALIIPTMDMRSWGLYERRMLHGRLAPIRAAEYGIPVFGVWSSGESQLTDHTGRIIATAGYPGPGEIISGRLDLQPAGHVPIDRYPAMAFSIFSAALLAYFLCLEAVARWRARKQKRSALPRLDPEI